MTRAAVLLAALAALRPAVAAAEAVELSSDVVAANIPDPTVRELYVSLKGLDAEAYRLGIELRDLMKEYEADSDPGRLAGRRESLRAGLRPVLDRLDGERRKFAVLSRSSMLSVALDSVGPGKQPPSDLDWQVGDHVHKFGDRLRVMHQIWEGVLEKDEAAFAAATRRAEQGRIRRRLLTAAVWIGGAAAVLAAMTGASFLRRRRAARLPPSGLPFPAPLPEPEFGGYMPAGRASAWSFGTRWPAAKEGGPSGVVKVLSRDHSGDGAEAGRTAALLRAATAFRHPGVIPVSATGASSAGVYLLEEACPGRLLSEVLAEGSALGADAALRALAPVAAALDAAHGARLAHGGLTPERIIVLPDGTGRMTEFGLVRALVARRPVGSGAFSPAYAAPEALEGKIVLASDLFSFGVILYEMLFVRLPFEGTNLAALKAERRHPAPSGLLGRPAPEADAFFAGILEPAARRRKPTPGGLAAALKFLSGPA